MSRILHGNSHSDGANSWNTARVAPPRDLAADLYAHADYRERTGGFTMRRELPHAEGVLIVNLGEPITITGGDGQVLQLAAGKAFVAGTHLRPALSQSNGAQAGMHVFLPLTTLRRLLGVPMSQLIDQVAALNALLGVEARDLSQRLCGAGNLAQRVEALDALLCRARSARLAAAAP